MVIKRLCPSQCGHPGESNTCLHHPELPQQCRRCPSAIPLLSDYCRHGVAYGGAKVTPDMAFGNS